MSPPPTHPDIALTYPTEHILLVTIQRAGAMNSLGQPHHAYLDALWTWYDAAPTLRVAILTGSAPPANSRMKRAFCAGADLKEWLSLSDKPRKSQHSGGFGGLSQRAGKKPVIAAVHGACLGGGMEMALNCDMVVAHKSSVFGLPEVKRGVVAIVGGLQRLVVTVGLQRASEMALTGRSLDAGEAKEWGLVNEVVEGDVVEAAVRWAKMIEAVSPDSVIVSRQGLRGTGVYGDVADHSQRTVEQGVWQGLQKGENIKEGLRAFVEKRNVRWVDSKL